MAGESRQALPATESDSPGVGDDGDALAGKFGEAFEALAQAQGVAVCARTRWLSIWARAHPEVEVELAAVHSGGALVAAAILGVRRTRFGTVDVILAGDGDCDLAALPASDAAAASDLAGVIADKLGGRGRRWRLRFEQLPCGDPVVEALAGRLGSVRRDPGDRVPVTVLEEDRSPAKYLSQKFRKETRRLMRRFSEAHEVEVQLLRDPAQIAGVAAELEHLRRARDHDLGRPSSLDHAGGLEFWRGVIADGAGDGSVDLVLVYADRELAAYTIGIADGVLYHVWDGRIATRFAAYSPGQIADVHLFDELLTRPELAVLDYGRGDLPPKRRFANDVVETQRFRAWSSRPLMFTDLAIARVIAGLRDAKRRFPHAAAPWVALKRAVLRFRHP